MDKQQRDREGGGRVVRGARNRGEGEAYTAPRTRLHARTREYVHAVVTDRVPRRSSPRFVRLYVGFLVRLVRSFGSL